MDEDTASSLSNPGESQANPGGSQTDSGESQGRALVRFEARLAQMEAQIKALQEGVSDLNTYARMTRQRALHLRIGVLVALLAAFFFLQYFR